LTEISNFNTKYAQNEIIKAIINISVGVKLFAQLMSEIQIVFLFIIIFLDKKCGSKGDITTTR